MKPIRCIFSEAVNATTSDDKKDVVVLKMNNYATTESLPQLVISQDDAKCLVKQLLECLSEQGDDFATYVLEISRDQ